MEERNEREQKVKALAPDLPVDPLQMRAPPIISLLPLAAETASHIHARVMHTQTHTSVGSKTEREAYFFCPKWREREKEREVEGRL